MNKSVARNVPIMTSQVFSQERSRPCAQDCLRRL